MKRSPLLVLALAATMVGCGPSCATDCIPASTLKQQVDSLNTYVPALIEEHRQANPNMSESDTMLWDQRLENLQHLKDIVDQSYSPRSKDDAK